MSGCFVMNEIHRKNNLTRFAIKNRAKSRISLSIRQLEEDPLLETLDKVIPLVSC